MILNTFLEYISDNKFEKEEKIGESWHFISCVLQANLILDRILSTSSKYTERPQMSGPQCRKPEIPPISFGLDFTYELVYQMNLTLYEPTSFELDPHQLGVGMSRRRGTQHYANSRPQNSAMQLRRHLLIFQGKWVKWTAPCIRGNHLKDESELFPLIPLSEDIVILKDNQGHPLTWS